MSGLRLAITGRGRAGEGASSSASSSDAEGDLPAASRAYSRQKSPLAAQVRRQSLQRCRLPFVPRSALQAPCNALWLKTYTFLQ